jgi:hypothetical protein
MIGLTLEVRTDEAPRMMNRVARVTMNDGRPVRTTMKPLITPRKVVIAIPMMIDDQSGRFAIVARIAMTIPAKPTIDPIDRSNSPAIISNATEVAMTPICAATSR